MSGKFLTAFLVAMVAMTEAQRYGGYQPKQAACKPEIQYVTRTETVPQYITITPEYITETQTVERYVTQTVPQYVTRTEQQQQYVTVTKPCNSGYRG